MNDVESTSKPEKSKKKKWIIIGAAIVIIIGIVAVASSGGKKSQPNVQGEPVAEPIADETTVTFNGQGTAEAYVGQDVTWTATITNTGTVDIPVLTVNTDFGGMDYKSMSPTPNKQTIQDQQEFGPIKPGQSLAITYNLLATEVGVAEGFIDFSGNFDTDDKLLRLQTTVR